MSEHLNTQQLIEDCDLTDGEAETLLALAELCGTDWDFLQVSCDDAELEVDVFEYIEGNHDAQKDD